jgi:hypothetical protein
MRLRYLLHQEPTTQTEITMKINKTEAIAGGALTAIAGATLAGYLYNKTSNRSYKRNYNPASVEELEGRVEDMLYTGRENGEDRGVELILDTGDDLIPVHLGPAWYIDHQKEKIKRGDKIMVRGSRVNHNHEPALIAEMIIHGDMAVRLRDTDGHPLWSAWSKL